MNMQVFWIAMLSAAIGYSISAVISHVIYKKRLQYFKTRLLEIEQLLKVVETDREFVQDIAARINTSIQRMQIKGQTPPKVD